MSPQGPITVGASLSLSGRYGGQGRQAAGGLRLWASGVESRGGISLAGDSRSLPVRLEILDDGSRGEAARANVRALIAGGRADLLIGPYGSDLVRAVMPVAEEQGKVLWNHGGAADDLGERGWRRLVCISSPASAYLRHLPRLLPGEPGSAGVVILRAARGEFAGRVAAGLAAAAAEAGLGRVEVLPFPSPVQDAGALVARALDGAPSALVTIGTFADDVRIVEAVRAGGPGPAVLAAVGAGMGAFGRELGPAAEGVIGPSQWEPAMAFPNLVGPDAGTFVAEYRRTFGEPPDYPAAQAFAAGLVAEACLRRAGGLADDPLGKAARDLDVTTLYGRFRIDAETGRQVGHAVLLVAWRDGRKVVLGPGEVGGHRG